VGLVAALAGALFATNAGLFRGGDERHPQNFTDLVELESARLEELATQVAALRAEVASLIEQESGRTPALEEVPAETELASGRLAVQGPGVVVQLWDAPQGDAPVGARPDDLVVHQQDLESVMNALWAGGAEAMTIQGDRVTSWTAVRCVGSVLLMAGRTYSPPYEVAVIGDPDALLAALDASPGVQIYLQYVRALGLGWSVRTRPLIEMPAAEGARGLEHAVVAAASGPPNDSP
jgi:uncharacterized protein YlxW (UPF0749 family)